MFVVEKRMSEKPLIFSQRRKHLMGSGEGNADVIENAGVVFEVDQ